MPKLLIIDDERNVLYALEKGLRRDDLVISTAQTGTAGIAAVQQEMPDAVLLDVQLPDQSGLQVLQQLQHMEPRLPVIMMTAHGTAETAIEAMKHGAYDYVLKPWKLDELRALILQALQASRLQRVPAVFDIAGNQAAGNVERIVGKSDQMQNIFKEIGRIAQQDVSVLILGESGTGKELVARAIYHHSRRKDQPFLAINCAALPDNLLESELFGHEKGAFTGADRRRIGKFEQAHQGTLFLDEIGDMALVTQAKVLRVLQDGQFERVGGNETIQTHVRIIAATNKDLNDAIRKKEFRQDLYYRLNTFILNMPPLRERKDDLPALIEHFIRRHRSQLGQRITGVSEEALQIMSSYSWPGNVRELDNAIKYALVHARGNLITPDALPRELLPSVIAEKDSQESTTTVGALPELEKLIDKMLQENQPQLLSALHDIVDRALLTRVLEQAGGQQTRAASLLGISRNTLRTRLLQLGLTLDKVVREEPDDA